MNIDIKIGDILLTGKFKNQRMEVKEIGTSDIGQPTVNDQQLLAVRIEKLLPKDMQSSKTKEENMEKGSAYLEKIASEAFINELREIAGY